MSNQNIPISVPSIDNSDLELITECIKTNFVSSAGAFVNKFENNLSELHSNHPCVLTNTGTSALHSALVSLGIGNTDTVITQSYSFVATANAIKYTGADLLFTDIVKNQGLIDVDEIEALIKDNCYLKENSIIHRATGKKLSAVVPVLSFGKSPDTKKLKNLKIKYPLKIILDAAGALGNQDLYRSDIFDCCDAIIYSFNGNKIITTGGGGAVIVKDKNLAVKIKHLTTTARNYPTYHHDHIGFNYRMPNLNAALGVTQLRKLNEHVENKMLIYDVVREAISYNTEWSILEHETNRSNFWLMAIKYEGNSTEKLVNTPKLFMEHGLTCAPFWQPLHEMNIFSGSLKNDLTSFQNTNDLSSKLFVLPSSPSLSRENINRLRNCLNLI